MVNGSLAPEITAERLLETRLAFDSVADDYDGPRGNNALIQTIRRAMWKTVVETFTAGSRLCDLGCGTGLDAAYLAKRGFRVLALDWSPEMIHRTCALILEAGLQERITAKRLGIHELDALEDTPFDGMYSNLGAVNCVPDLAPVARACARHLRPGGRLIFSVIGRYCPWEIGYYLLTGHPARAFIRMRRGAVRVGLNGGAVWTRYYTPREFYLPFEEAFELTQYRSLRLFSPPPYLIGIRNTTPRLFRALERLGERLGDRPVFRNAGDHFLIILTKRA